MARPPLRRRPASLTAIAEITSVNALVKRRTPHQHPAARHTTRNATWPTTEPADGAEPVVAARHSSTACHSGENHATGSQPVGERLTGKNVPENRNSGNSPMRMMTANGMSLSCVTA